MGVGPRTKSKVKYGSKDKEREKSRKQTAKGRGSRHERRKNPPEANKRKRIQLPPIK